VWLCPEGFAIQRRAAAYTAARLHTDLHIGLHIGLRAHTNLEQEVLHKTPITFCKCNSSKPIAPKRENRDSKR